MRRENQTKKLALYYFKTVAEVARESFLILDSDQRVILANQVFYQNFQVSPEQTETKLLYELGNGQWDIPSLRNLMEKILPDKKTVKDYVVEHSFETIGKKIILLNARSIDTTQLIILAMEDVTEKMMIEKKLMQYTKELELKVDQRTAQLKDQIKELKEVNKSMIDREIKMIELKKEIEKLKKK